MVTVESQGPKIVGAFIHMVGVQIDITCSKIKLLWAPWIELSMMKGKLVRGKSLQR